jgi:excisionase family DNA binding protein
LLTVPQVAEATGLSTHQVYRRLQRGDLPSVPDIDGQHDYLVHVDDLRTWVDAGMPLSRPRRDPSTMHVPEVARLTGFSDATIRRLCQEGRLEYYRGAGKAGRYRILRSSVQDFIGRNNL